MELPRAVAVVAVVPLLLLLVGLVFCCGPPRSVVGEVPCGGQIEGGPIPGEPHGPAPSGYGACTCPSPPKRRWRRTTVDVVRSEGRGDDVGETAHVRWRLLHISWRVVLDLT